VTLEGRKNRKSLGNALRAQALVDRYGADASAITYLRHLHTTADSDFSERLLVAAHDNDSPTSLENLVRRALSLVAREFLTRILSRDYRPSPTLPCAAKESVP